MDKENNKLYNNSLWKDALKENLKFEKEKLLRDNYTYTVHTTCSQGDERSSDCFYGWGKPRDEDDSYCIQHTILNGLSFDNAAWISRLLASAGYEVVVTRSDDWDKFVYDPDIALVYRAMHIH